MLRRLLRRTAVRFRATAGAHRVAFAVLAGAPLVAHLAGASTEATERSLLAAVIYAGVALPFCVALGGPGSGRGRAAALLWLQKPCTPWGLHLARLAPRLLGGLVATGAVSAAGVVVALVLGSGTGVERITDSMPVLLLCAPVVVVGVHASSGLGLRPEPLMALVFLAGLVAPRLAEVLAPEVVGPWAPLIDLLALPVDEIPPAARFLRYPGGGGGSDLWVVLRFCAIWTVVGVLAQARPGAWRPAGTGVTP